MDKIKWYTEMEYVNRENGEYITKSQWQREKFIKLETIIKHEKSNEKYGIRKITNIGERSRQLEMW